MTTDEEEEWRVYVKLFRRRFKQRLRELDAALAAATPEERIAFARRASEEMKQRIRQMPDISLPPDPSKQ